MRDRWSKWREVFGSETDYIIKLWSCFHDPEQQEGFLETCRTKKKANARWSIYDDYPTSENATVRARNECCDFVKSLIRPKEENESNVG